MDEEELTRRIDVFIDTGSAVFDMPNGKRLFLISSGRIWTKDDPHRSRGILISLEGSGSCFWQAGTKLTQAVLFTSGISVIVTPTVLKTIERIVQHHRLRKYRELRSGSIDHMQLEDQSERHKQAKAQVKSKTKARKRNSEKQEKLL